MLKNSQQKRCTATSTVRLEYSGLSCLYLSQYLKKEKIEKSIKHACISIDDIISIIKVANKVMMKHLKKQ